MRRITNNFSFSFFPVLLPFLAKKIPLETNCVWDLSKGMRIYARAMNFRRLETSPPAYRVRNICVSRLRRPAWLVFTSMIPGYRPARFEYPQVRGSQQWYRSRAKGPRGTRSNSVTRYALSNGESFLSIYSRWISDDFIKLVSCRASTNLGSDLLWYVKSATPSSRKAQ